MPPSHRNSKQAIEHQRATGSYYTPAFVAQAMVAGTLREWTPAHSATTCPLTILDPACGDGSLILAAYAALIAGQPSHPSSVAEVLLKSVDGWCDFDRSLDLHGLPGQPHVRDATTPAEASISPASTSSERLALIRNHLFGVDIDRQAVEALRRQLYRLVASPPDEQEETLAVLQQNFLVGDSLTGPEFRPASKHFDFVDAEDEEPVVPLDFATAFPQVARNGGFGCIIGNPPYRRELNAKSLFDQLANTPLGRKWRQPRMDLWFYFLHRGLDLLRPGGRLTFIVNSYWTSSSSAERLIRRLQTETQMLEIILLGEIPIFENVAGRHLIFRIERPLKRVEIDADQPCQILDLEDSSRTAPCESGSASQTSHAFSVPHGRLFQNGRLIVSRSSSLWDQLSTSATLGQCCEIRQGIAENPPRINQRHRRKFGDHFQPGEGVFVLTTQELSQLNLTTSEREILRPYVPVSAVDRYRQPSATTAHAILYLCRQTATDLASFPNVRQHLERFRPILEQRRETRQGLVPWWYLHWPREERIFTQPRILAMQMGRVPQFVYCESPTFVGFSINLILAKSTCRFSLRTITGILNSSLARKWFECFAKRRGVNLDISGTMLRDFPLPEPNPLIADKIDALVARRQDWEALELSARETADRERIEQAIDRHVLELYELSSLEPEIAVWFPRAP